MRLSSYRPQTKLREGNICVSEGGGRGLVPSHSTPTPGPYPLPGPQKAGGSNRVKFLLKKYFVRICNTFFLQSGVEKSMCPFWNFLAFYWHFSWLQFEYFTIIQPISFYWDQHEMRRYTVIIVQYQVIKAPFTQIESDIAWICTMLLFCFVYTYVNRIFYFYVHGKRFALCKLY